MFNTTISIHFYFPLKQHIRLSYHSVVTEAVIGVHMGELGIGPPIIGLQEAHGKSNLPAIVMRYFINTIPLATLIANAHAYGT